MARRDTDRSDNSGETVEHLWRRAQLYRQNHRPRQAIQLLRQIADREPSADTYAALGDTHREAGDLWSSAKAYQRAVQMDPSHLPSLVALGTIHTDMGHHEHAARAYAHAMRFHPNVPQVHVNLGNAFARLGQLEEAEVCYLKALALDPVFRDADRAYYNLARVYAMTDRGADALEALKLAAEHNPSRAVDALNDDVFEAQRDDPDFDAVIRLGEQTIFRQLRELMRTEHATPLREKIASSSYLQRLIRSRRQFACFRSFLPPRRG